MRIHIATHTHTHYKPGPVNPAAQTLFKMMMTTFVERNYTQKKKKK